MTEMKVWAPSAQKVELESSGQRLAMNKSKSGWWKVEVPSIKHGSAYAFVVDGNGPFPDPRSGWQPEGVHKPSAWVDHSQFSWSDEGWQPPPLAAGPIYELHIGTFTPEGTFEAAIERLDYLANLGVTHIELMPVAEFSGNHGWGYDGVDLYAPHHAYGGPLGLKKLVDACHKRGLAVIQDVVYNHLGPAGNYLSQFGPYFTNRYSTPWGEAVNFDGPDSDEVRRFFIDNALMWLRDYHMDGLRLDAVHALVDESAVHFMEQLATEVNQLEGQLGRRMSLIAESNLNDPRLIRPPELGGYGLHAQWSDDFHHAVHTLLTGEKDSYYEDFGRMEHLAKALTDGFVYDGNYSVHRRRVHGRPGKDLRGHTFVVCLQNHDQVGNRAVGERFSHLLTPGQMKLAAALMLTSPFLPMLWQGEEWAASSPFLYFTDHQDPELGEAVRKGRQSEFAAFGWNPDEVPNPQDEQTFLRSKLNWNEIQEEPHKGMVDWYRSLIELRHQISDLFDDRLHRTAVDFDEDARWLVMTRGSVTVACNFSETEQRVSADLEGRSLVLASDPGIELHGEQISLPGHSVAILNRAS